MERLTQLLRRFERVIRYVLVGAGVTLFYTLLTVALIASQVVSDPTVAAAIASLATFPVSFLAHRAITYADVAREPAHWWRFAVISATNFVIATGTMKAVDLLGLPYWIALMIGWIVIPISTYLISAIWVFRAKRLLALDDPAVPN